MRTTILLLAMTIAPHTHAQFWREDFNGPALDPRWRTSNLGQLRYDLENGQFNVRGFGGGGPARGHMIRDAGDLTFEFDFRSRVTFADGPRGAFYFNIGNVEFSVTNEFGPFVVYSGAGFDPLPITPGTREFRAVGNDGAWSLYIDDLPVVVNRPIPLDRVYIRVGFLGYPQTTTQFFPCSIDYIEILPVPAPGVCGLFIGAPFILRRRR